MEFIYLIIQRVKSVENWVFRFLDYDFIGFEIVEFFYRLSNDKHLEKKLWFNGIIISFLNRNRDHPRSLIFPTQLWSPLPPFKFQLSTRNDIVHTNINHHFSNLLFAELQPKLLWQKKCEALQRSSTIRPHLRFNNR